AEALGRIGDDSAVRVLLECAGLDNDRVLQHSLTYALIEIGARQPTAQGLRSSNPHIRRTALIALDQMDGGNLQPSDIAADLVTADPVLKETAWWIASRHPEWGGALSGILRDRLGQNNLTAAESDELAGQLAKFARSKPVQEFLAERVVDSLSPVEARRIALRAMARSGLKEAPTSWTEGLTRMLTSRSQELLSDVGATARSVRVPENQAKDMAVALLIVASDVHAPVDVRLIALAAAPGGVARVERPLFSLLCEQLEPGRPVATRSLAAEVLSR